MKISQKELENLIKEEVGGALEEGPFSRMFNKAIQGLKTRNVAKQDKEMGIQRTTGPEKQQPVDKFMDNKTKKDVVRISAEILSDPSVKLDATKALKQIDAKKSLGAKGRSKWDIFREEEQLNEATPKEINLYSKLINQAIKDKKMTLEDLLDDVLSLADTNPVVNAIAGVEDLKRFKQKAQPEAAPEAAPSTAPESEKELDFDIDIQEPEQAEPEQAGAQKLDFVSKRTTPTDLKPYPANQAQLARQQYAGQFGNLSMQQVVFPILKYLVSNGLLYPLKQLKEIDAATMQQGFRDIALTKKGQPRMKNPLVPTKNDIKARAQAQSKKEKPEPQKQKDSGTAPKIWQDTGVKTKQQLFGNTDYKKMATDIQKTTAIKDLNVVNSVLYKLWQLGTLAKPIPKQADFQAQDDDEMTYGFEGPDVVRESKRWQKLAGILKD